MVYTVPQLSAYSLAAATCALSSGKLFALLSNSHVHVWELHLKRPPSMQVGGRMHDH